MSGREATSGRKQRPDAERSKQALLVAAARVFATSGVDATVREVAADAGVGMGTLYRHFPTRADLVVAVFRHQIDACAEAGPVLASTSPTPFAAVLSWAHLFVDFLATKHGMAKVWQGDADGLGALHELFLARLVPVLGDLLEEARNSGEVVAEVGAYEVIRAIGDLVAWTIRDPNYDVRRIVTLLITGLRVEQPAYEPIEVRALR